MAAGGHELQSGLVSCVVCQLSMSKSVPQNAMLYFKICLVDWTIDRTTIFLHLDRNMQYLSSITQHFIHAKKKIL